MLLTQDVRRQFLQYFKDHGHAVVPSSSVVPHDDPTLLFTNAGMNQFKDVFLGRAKRDYTRATSSQKCIRVGGKHNDLDNVGHTSRHLTFFEMLGNFSFGDYFKEQAIAFAWQVATEVFKFPAEKIWPTVYKDDDEAFELWKKWVPEERIVRFGEKENFWAMGDTGPCGPCSELLFDRGPAYGSAQHPYEDSSGERYLEFWNLVFMQYNRDAEGNLSPLPKQSIDTGAGLERVMSLIQGVDNVFETDTLRAIIGQVEAISGKTYTPENPDLAAPFRVIADHIRMLSFAIADGAQPSNTERGYVLRKVLRRAVRYGRHLGLDEPFLARVLPKLVEKMGSDYPELVAAQGRIAEILTNEEHAFLRTLRRGGNLLQQVVERARAAERLISGDDAFKLKDTYGLPLEEILLIAKDTGLNVDLDRFEVLDAQAREKSRAAQKVTAQEISAGFYEELAKKHGKTEFCGYETTQAQGKILAILQGNELVDSLPAGEQGILIMTRTPFYAEMGGQVGDRGWIHGAGEAEVTDTQQLFTGLIGHQVRLDTGVLRVGDDVDLSVDAHRRQLIGNNHTATHLLHWALCRVLGDQVRQAGSVVDADRLRFDFSHHKAMTPAELQQVEDIVNEQIRLNRAVHVYEVPYEQAQKRTDIKQFFGEKYGSQVRVVDLEDSKELCGGTHTSATGNIGLFRILKESSVAAGIRRIEAVTGAAAMRLMRETERQLAEASEMLKTQPGMLLERIAKILEEQRSLEADLKSMQKRELVHLATELASKREQLGHVEAVISTVPPAISDLRGLAEELAGHLKRGIIVLGSDAGGRVQLVVRSQAPQELNALEIIRAIASHIEGGGGGKADFAQAGGKRAAGIVEAFEHARNLIQGAKV
jgi:alanyl-tRNA synthetase